MTTAPFDPAPQHTALSRLAGTWSGPTRLWLDPSGPPDESETAATVEVILGGRFVRVAYTGVAMGKPHAGELVLGFHKDAGEHEASWIDSFHTGTAIMMSVGRPRADGTIDVLGSYAAGPERWGWRTLVHDAGDELVIESKNIAPSGEEYPAVETRLRRAR